MEYAIWGIPPKETEETLLVSNPNGNPIIERKEAKRIKVLLEKKHGCTAVRIQELDFKTLPDFSKAVI